MPTVDELNQGFTLGEWTVLPAKGVLRRGDEEIKPEPKVFDCLVALALRDGDLVTKDELIAEVWKGHIVSDEPIQRCISQLRGIFQDKKPYRYIETLQGKGYRLKQRIAPRVQPQSGRRWQAVMALVAAGLIAVVLIVNWVTPQEPVVRSLAVLPIQNLSGDPANQYLVDGIKNTLAQRLAELPDFTIKNARIPYVEYEPPRIARQLNVESVLTGALQLQGETIRVTWHIARGDDGVTIRSGEVTGTVSDLFTVQERLANNIRDELAGPTTPRLLVREAPDSEAYNSFMRGMYALEHRGEPNKLELAIELFQDAIRRDSAFGPAYLELATAYTLMPDYRDAPLENMHRLAVETVQRGIAIDDSISDAAGAIFGFHYHQQKRWQESEAAHQAAVAAPFVDSNAFNWYSRMLSSVGRLQDALDVILAAGQIDPYNPVVISRIAIAYTYLGETQLAHDYFRRADDLGATGTTHLLAHSLLLNRDGQAERAIATISAATAMAGAPTDWVEPVFAALGDLSKRGPALEALDAAWQERVLSPAVNVTARTLLGDIEGAMKVAWLLEQPGEIFEMDLLWVPEMAALREHPDFMLLLERLGINDYWQQAGCNYDGDRVSCAAR